MEIGAKRLTATHAAMKQAPMNVGTKPFFTQALDALKAGDRRAAAALLKRQLHEGNTSAKNLPSVVQLAMHIGDVGLAIEASRATVVRGSAESLLAHWSVLATLGRSDEAMAELERQPAAVRNNPYVLHFRATVANQFGRLAEAEELFRKALAGAPMSMRTWFALAMLKTFTPGDPDLARMIELERHGSGPNEARASICYAIGKALEDIGEVDRAFEYYEKGAAIRRAERPFDIGPFRAAAEQAIRDFTAENMAKLVPSQFGEVPSLFVTGLPRSGTTLTEQMLINHSAVHDGAELNLFGTALIPARGSFAGAIDYQQRSDADPWGDVGRDYAGLLHQHFGSAGLVVDKSLGQSLLIGLMLHAVPRARIAWLRRNPDDVALSCFRTYFTTGIPWSWSLTDIADQMRIEDELFDHWAALFPDRILPVPYEELVADPETWAERLQRHFELPVEPGLEKASNHRAVRTASVTQVREPISAKRIGQAVKFERQLKPFRDRYYR